MIRLPYVEADLLTECTLRCAHCSVHTPYLADAWKYSAEEFAADVALMRGEVEVERLMFIGGEPTILPDLARYVTAARESGAFRAVDITTNGLTAERLPDDVLRAFDCWTVCVYSSATDEQRAAGERAILRLRALGVGLIEKRISAFSLQEYDGPEMPTAHVARIWDECWQRVKCTSLHRGRIYLCTAGRRHVEYLRRLGRSVPDAEGVDLAGPDLGQRLDAYLRRGTPLAMCRWCIGCSSRWGAHRQLSAAECSRRRPVVVDPGSILRWS